jgi:hypothetical protein
MTQLHGARARARCRGGINRILLSTVCLTLDHHGIVAMGTQPPLPSSWYLPAPTCSRLSSYEHPSRSLCSFISPCPVPMTTAACAKPITIYLHSPADGTPNSKRSQPGTGNLTILLGAALQRATCKFNYHAAYLSTLPKATAAVASLAPLAGLIAAAHHTHTSGEAATIHHPSWSLPATHRFLLVWRCCQRPSSAARSACLARSIVLSVVVCKSYGRWPCPVDADVISHRSIGTVTARR